MAILGGPLATRSARRDQETATLGRLAANHLEETLPVPQPLAYLVARSRELLRMNQSKLADFLGVGTRTVQRWEARRATPYARNIHQLADAVRPHDAAVAADLDAWSPRAAPPPAPAAPPEPPPPPPPPPIPVGVLVDSIVCAAAEALGVAPQAIRPALLAAFARAHEARLLPDAVVAALQPPPPVVAPPPEAESRAKPAKRAG